MTEDRKNTDIAGIPGTCGFSAESEPPDDSACPVTRHSPDFSPSKILNETRSGWFPKGATRCIGCEKCSIACASFTSFMDKLIISRGFEEGFIPRAFGGAHHAWVDIQKNKNTRQNRTGWLFNNLSVSGTGEIALFVGCAPYYDAIRDYETDFKATDEAVAGIKLLNALGVNPVVLPDEPCCGGDRLHIGDIESFISLGGNLRDQLKAHGVKTVLTTCDDCRYTLANRHREFIPGWDFEIIRLSDYLLQHQGTLSFMPVDKNVSIQPPDIYSDPLKISSVKMLLDQITSLSVHEIRPEHPSTSGSWNQSGAISKLIETGILKSAESTGAEVFVVPSTRLLARLINSRRPGAWQETSIEITGLYSFLEERHTIVRDFAG